MKALISASLLTALLIAPATAASPTQPLQPPPATPFGDWLVEDATAHIRVQQCGPSLWGIISWTKEPGGVDEHNPDPAKQTRPILGLPILLNMKSTSANRWDGEVYNAEDGNIYNAHIELTGPDTIRIEGCVMGGLICSGESWKKLPPPPKNDPLADVCSFAAK